MHRFLNIFALISFIFVASFSTANGAHHDDGAKNVSVDVVLQGIDESEKYSAKEDCDCKNQTGPALACGVVLALVSDDVDLYSIQAVKCSYQWSNRIGLELATDTLKRPPRLFS